MRYEKPPISTDDHIRLLRQRGLLIRDEKHATKFIESIGYYRLTGYMYHLQSSDGDHGFYPGITFGQVIDTYHFDKKLRMLLMDYLERIEVSLRALMTNRFSLEFGFFWYTDVTLFDRRDVFDMIQADIHDSVGDEKEQFIKAFKSKYTSERLPPSNMALELLSFGKLTRLYDGLKSAGGKNDIASAFGLPSSILSSWLIYLNNVRNVCAHHCRLWNRRITADRPAIPTRKKYAFAGFWDEHSNTTVYGVVTLISKLLDSISPGHRFRQKLIDLLENFPEINKIYMGFPTDWKTTAAFL
ncbi:Abi family protein [Algoriphagus sp. H41]|uniref:Abi family protein n=1 Tax=Algoriphagus oliviformis TaxID=2811231 RepID=A0ABS3C7H9_9BACT|nr:Abi family protein [Algoriphagus oliviformis]MBN7813079.1 Abi family protein [Algoriphagus oliviformis]